MYLLSLEITYFDFFAHLSQALGKLVNQVHLDAEVDREIGVLVSGVDCLSDIEVDICRFFEQHSADQGSAVLLEAPVLVVSVFSEVVSGIFKYAVDRNNTFCYEVDAFNLGDGREVGIGEIQTCFNRLSEIFCRDGGSCASANDMLSSFGEEECHHSVGVVAVGGGGRRANSSALSF